MKQIGEKPKILVVLGPTATGKSDLGVRLAKDFDSEIISADSRQVYKGLDIGSGKITKKEMQGVPHHLLDIFSVQKVFTVADFQKRAYLAIDQILSRGRVPIIVGGTGFYIQSIVEGLVLPKIKKNPLLRKKLENMNLKDLQDQLYHLDPARFAEIDKQNKIRLIRAIEIASQIEKVPKLSKNPLYDTLQIGLTWPREIIKKRIHDRLLSRIKIGMISEVKKLHQNGASWHRLEDLGLEYRYLALFLQGKISKQEMLEKLEIKINQFSKRQITWWKRDTNIKWFTPKEYFEIKKIVRNFLK